MVDILLSTFNGELYLSEQIESIINQNYHDWILYIRDDGSSDGTLNIIKKYTEKYQLKIIFIEDSLGNIGAAKSFLELISYSKADYFMFCDQDDVWLPNKIEITLNKMVSIKEKNPDKPVLIHSDMKIVDSNLKTISESFWKYKKKNPNVKNYERLVVDNNITGCTMMVSCDIKKYINIDKNDYIIMHDWLIGVLVSYFGIIDYVDVVTILYRQHGNNSIGAKSFVNRFKIFYFVKEIENSINKYIEQSKTLVKVIDDKKLREFSEIKSRGFMYRKYWCLRNGFCKGFWVERVLFLVVL
jgi:glycosyltransferase involved in cell wall biosynthesis